MTREEAIICLKGIKNYGRDTFTKQTNCDWQVCLKMAIEALEQEPCEDMGEVSDGYHTFNQLYHQRAVLFATIVNQNKDKAWKSYKHSDGKYCFDSNGEWFIVGVDTPEGSYTYHYEKKYWDMFDCQELECGKKWDGHTEEDVTRLLSLQQEPQPCEDCVSRKAIFENRKLVYEEYASTDNEKAMMEEIAKLDEKLPSVQPPRTKAKLLDNNNRGTVLNPFWDRYVCSNCGHCSDLENYCANCGAEMEDE